MAFLDKTILKDILGKASKNKKEFKTVLDRGSESLEEKGQRSDMFGNNAFLQGVRNMFREKKEEKNKEQQNLLKNFQKALKEQKEKEPEKKKKVESLFEKSKKALVQPAYDILNPGETFLEPFMEKKGAPKTLAFMAGLGVDLLVPGPGEAKRLGALTTKSLRRLANATSKKTVSKQFVEDLLNRPGVKQAEKDLMMNKLDEMTGLKAFEGEVESKLFSGMRKHADNLGMGKKADTVEGSVVLENYIKKTDPKLYEAIEKRAKRSGTPIMEGQNRVSGFIQEQFDTAKEFSKNVKVDVDEYIGAVNTDLLPLRTAEIDDLPRAVEEEMVASGWEPDIPGTTVARYQHVTLPDELRGNVAAYGERIYESPIPTTSISTHYDFLPSDLNYFAHTRIEDMADVSTQGLSPSAKSSLFEKAGTDIGDTRRVIEMQSDLMQKGKLEEKIAVPTKKAGKYIAETQDRGNAILKEGDIKPGMVIWEYSGSPNMVFGYFKYLVTNYENGIAKLVDVEKLPKTVQSEMRKQPMGSQFVEGYQKYNKLPGEEVSFKKGRRSIKKGVSKLQPYKNDWWKRITKEEVRKAAKDGKEKLQFPTGETGMKVEGLGSTERWKRINRLSEGRFTSEDLTIEKIKPGTEVQPFAGAGVALGEEQGRWIITENLGDGKFKALPKDKTFSNFELQSAKKGELTESFTGRKISPHELTRDWLKKNTQMKKIEGTDVYKTENAISETFDISGKADTENPIYKFYENDVGKYLKKNYNAKRITDEQGVDWYQVDVPESASKVPVEAFGGAGMKTLIGAGAGVGIAALSPFVAKIAENWSEKQQGKMEQGLEQAIDNAKTVDDLGWISDKLSTLNDEDRQTELMEKIAKKYSEIGNVLEKSSNKSILE